MPTELLSTTIVVARPEAAPGPGRGTGHSHGRSRSRPQATTPFGEPELRLRVDEIAHRRPSVGLAVGIVRRGRLEAFAGHGLASIAAGTPITEDTVFRIGSVTKLFSAIAVMQLVEDGRIELDAPAGDSLRAYRLIPAEPGLRPPTLRHLLTHTAGIPEVIHLRDVLHPGWGSFGSRPAIPSVALGEPMPSLAEYYRGGLRFVVEPGTAFAYSNHGFATVGQVLEDATGLPLERLFRERIFEPLGMTDTDLVRSERVCRGLATGYEIGARGPEPVTDRDWLGPAGGGIYSTTRDLARFVGSLLAGGAGEHGRILRPETLATMLEPHFRSDPRLPGMGLAFFRGELDGHRIVEHDGIMPGFNALVMVAPDDDIGLIAMTNGASGAMAWLPIELGRLMRRLLGLPDEAPPVDLPHDPARWAGLCGRYCLPSRISDLRGRLVLRDVEVGVRGGRLVARLRTRIPALSATAPLEPDDPADPDVFRLDLSSIGMPVVRVVFARDAAGRAIAAHTDLMMTSLVRVPERGGPSPWLAGAAAAATIVAAARVARRRSRARTGDAR